MVLSLFAKDDYVLDLEKAMAVGEEQENLIPAVQMAEMIEREKATKLAAKVNPVGMKRKLYLCWLLLVASAMALTNHFFSHGGDNRDAQDINQIIPVLVKFGVLLCAICLMFRAMKE